MPMDVQSQGMATGYENLPSPEKEYVQTPTSVSTVSKKSVQEWEIPQEPIDWELPVDSHFKATEFNPFKGGIHCGKKRKTNPHMRAFWAATLAFTFAFIGWFAFAPLYPVVRVDLGICDNQEYVDTLPESERVKACKCKKECKSKIGSANIAAVSFDVVTRFLMGSVIEVFGPKLADCMFMAFGAVVVGCSAGVVSVPGLIVARFFVSCLGSTFVVNQFWNSIMFNRSIVGTANATAGGWGNLGGGLTQVLMAAVYRFWYDGVGLSLSAAWRASMAFPVLLYSMLVPWIFFCSQDTPTGKFDVRILGKTKKAGFMDYVRVCSDFNVLLMIFQYSACFGCELVMNNILASHFHDEFGMGLVESGFLALSFGGMNLFARSLGGIWSDWANARWHMTGRLWTHFISLFGQACALFAFGCIDKETGGWSVALVVLIIFAIFVNMAEGTSYGIVPYMIPQELAIVSAVVGAGGTFGAVIASWSFYKNYETLDAMKFHAAYIAFWALTCFAMRWDHLGSMFQIRDPNQQKEEKEGSPPPPPAEMVSREMFASLEARIRKLESAGTDI